MAVTNPLPDSSYDIEAIKARDPQALTDLVQRESARVYRCIYRVIRNEDEAENLTQETFLQALLKIETFRGEAKLSTWLCSIGINLARATLRKNKRVNVLEEKDIELLQPQFSTAGAALNAFDKWDPAKITERNERVSLVRQAIDRLPDDYRTVVLLRDIEGLPSAEVADMLDIEDGAVRVRLHRARKALKKMLDEYF